MSSVPSCSPDFDHAAQTARAIRLAALDADMLPWLWPQRIPLGGVTLLAGDPGLGKSLVTLDLVARVSRGISWPDEQGSGSLAPGADASDSQLHAPSSVLLLSAEDDLADTVRPRLEALGADLSKVVAIPAIPGQQVESMRSFSPFGLDNDDTPPLHQRAFELRHDLARLDQLLRAMSDCRLLVIDPISAYLGGVTDQDNCEIRSLMWPLAALAQQHAVAVLAVTHLRKENGAALDRAMGGRAFIATARAVWLVAKDPKSPQRRLLLPIKNDLAPEVSGLAFTIKSQPCSSEPIVQWSTDTIAVPAKTNQISANTIPGDARPRGRPNTERKDAMDWLRTRLACGPAPTSDVQEDADANGINKRTLRRAFSELHGETIRVGIGPYGRWMWQLSGSRGRTAS
jgi:hypothetical protein